MDTVDIIDDRHCRVDNDGYGRYWAQHDAEPEPEEEVKPYTAVGAALDSAARFKRRMNYGRVTQKQ